MMVGVLWMFQAIAFILVGLRLYTRLVVVHAYGIDDHFFNFSVVNKPPLLFPTFQIVQLSPGLVPELAVERVYERHRLTLP